MSVKVIVGAQWGDEGKGKIVDLLSANHEVVARFQGGANAGHTVVVGGEQVILHLIPSGILHPHVRCYIGNGVVVDPETLMAEISLLKSKKIDIKDRLFLSGNAHVILPYHKMLDRTQESDPNRFLGTTGRGIGPAYTDKTDRIGIRLFDLFHSKALEEKIRHNLSLKAPRIKEALPDAGKLTVEYLRYGEQLEELITDVSLMLNNDIERDKNILLEGAQGTLLDMDFGTYPYVTSSNPIAGSASTGLGIGPTHIDEVMGIVKAYSTRVGEGPFPTEFDEQFSEHVRGLGQEFGATTGRPRRCGWFDGVLARLAARVNGLTELAITKLDVLDSLESIKVCTEYDLNGETRAELPTNLDYMAKSEPVYETLPGWQTETRNITQFGDLPENARRYVRRIGEITGVPVRIVSVGQGREQTIVLD